MKRASIALLALVVLVGLSTVIASCRAGEVGRVDGKLRPCPRPSNCVCSEDENAPIAPLEFAGDPDRAFQSLVDFLEAEPRVSLQTVEPDYAHAVFKTRVMRFRDDVEFRVDAEQGVIHVRSASRVGYSDLGANRARIESIRERWQPPADTTEAP